MLNHEEIFMRKSISFEKTEQFFTIWPDNGQNQLMEEKKKDAQIMELARIGHEEIFLAEFAHEMGLEINDPILDLPMFI
jgi:hypothetical protein